MDEAKTPCKEQLRPYLKHCRRGEMERKRIKTEINVNWPCIPVVKSVKQLSCKKGIVCFSSSSPETFVVAITLVQRCYVSSREFDSQLERLYQKFVSFNLSNTSTMTCLASPIGAEIRYFSVSPAFRKLFNN